MARKCFTCRMFSPHSAPPIIVISPVNQTVLNFQNNATFSCTATGIPIPSIAWWRTQGGGRKHILLTPTERIQIDSDSTFGEDAITSSLTVYGAALPDAGEYVCIAENEAGVDTAIAVLQVDGKTKCCITY